MLENNPRCEKCKARLDCLSVKGCLIKYGFETCVPLEHHLDAFENSRMLENELQERFFADQTSGGAGLGFRDLQFEFDSQAIAEEAFEFAVKFLENAGYEINECGEGEAQVNGVYEILPYED